MIAITGASGQIGRHLLGGQFGSVRVLLRSTNGIPLGSDVTSVIGDLHQADFSEFLTNGVSTLILLANDVPSSHSYQISNEQMQLRLNSFERMIEQFERCSPEGVVVFASSGGRIYDEDVDHKKSEDSDLKPCTAYGYLKMRQEQILSDKVQGSRLKAVTLRISNPYVWDVQLPKQKGFISNVLDCGLHDRTFSFFDSTKSRYDFIYMDDLTKAIEVVLANSNIPKGLNHIYNVGFGLDHSLMDAFRIVEDALHKKIDYNIVENIGSPKFCSLDASKFKRDFNWNPSYDLRQGVKACLVDYERSVNKTTFNK